jgi:hypothetical protein
MKGQLLSLLEDYKKQCVLARFNFVTLTVTITTDYNTRKRVPHYQIPNFRFENETDSDEGLNTFFFLGLHEGIGSVGDARYIVCVDQKPKILSQEVTIWKDVVF